MQNILHGGLETTDLPLQRTLSDMCFLRDESFRQAELQNVLRPVYKKKVDEIQLLPELLEKLDLSLEEQYCEIEIPGLEEIMPVLHEIESLGGTSYLVGGSIRDPLIGRKPKDLDIEVHGLTQEQLMEVLRRHRGEPIGEGDEKDVGILIELQNDKGAFTGVTMFQAVGSTLSEPVDFSLPRREFSTGLDKNSFEFEHNPFLSIKDAAFRRENTINSIMYDPLNKRLLNPYGGLQDLVDKKLSIIDVHAFMEDPSRVIRAMAFWVRFGFEPDEEVMYVCRYMCVNGLLDYQQEIKEGKEVVQEKKGIPGELRRKVFDKIMLDGKDFTSMFAFMRETGIGERYFPYLMKLKETPQSPKRHPEGNTENHTIQVMQKACEICERDGIVGLDKLVVMYGTLLHDIAKEEVTDYLPEKGITSYGHEYAGERIAREFFKFLGVKNKKNNNELLERVVVCVKEHMMQNKIFTISSLKGKKGLYRKLLKKMGSKGSMQDLLTVMEADKLGRNNPHGESHEALYELYWLSQLADCQSLPKPYISGNDLMERGFPASRKLGEWKKKLLELQYQDTFASKEAAELWLDEKLAEGFDILTLETSAISQPEVAGMPEGREPKGRGPKRKKMSLYSS